MGIATRAAAGDPYVTARAAIIVDAASGDTLWERNADAPLPPASTTKVMTAILALESGRLDDWFTVSSNAAETSPSKIGLRPGERMALGDLLYAVLLNSANDAATVVAEGLAGSEDDFAARMNAKARSLGARNSHFVNPHGLTAEGHVSSARDLAKIFRYGLQLTEFREILETPRIKVPVESRRVHAIGLHSHNRLLTGYVHRVIGKTGYTRPAGRCFVGAASDGGREVVIALLGATDLWGDARRLVAHAFGEPSEAPTVVMASARGQRITTEGDEEVVERFRKSGVHVATARSHGRHGKTTATRSKTGAKKSSAKRSTKTHRNGSVETDAGKRYAVRLGPYSTRRAAETARDRLARSGYRAQVVGQALVVGSAGERARADQLASGLRLKGYRPTIVAAR